MINKNDYKPINIKGYKILFDLENLLRSLILSELGDRKEDWWSEIKTRKFVKEIDNKKGYESNLKKDIARQINYDEEFLGSDHLFIHEIYYTNMQNLYDIIYHFWDEHFKRIFVGKKAQDQFRPNFRYVTYLRNKVMHAKPIIEKEAEFVKSFYNDVKGHVQKSGLELIKFDKCIYLKAMLTDFRSEIKEHNNVFLGDYKSFETFRIDLYKSFNKEWWWDSERFPIFKEINVYYKIIEKLNQKLNNPKNTKYTIIGLIVEGDDAIKIRCSDLMRDIDSLIDAT